MYYILDGIFNLSVPTKVIVLVHQVIVHESIHQQHNLKEILNIKRKTLALSKQHHLWGHYGRLIHDKEASSLNNIEINTVN